MSIRNNVVFVLGAGASSEYGFPLGTALLANIRNDLNFRFDFGRTIQGNVPFYNFLRSRFGQQLQEYVDAGIALANVVNHYPSIDEAIHLFAGQKEVVQIGKMAIASQIRAAEYHSGLRNDGNQEISNVNGVNGWMPRLFSMIAGSLTREELTGAFETLSFINFNYDRSLEHYLYAAIQSLGIKSDSAREILGKAKIYRPYGSLGPLPWQDSKGIAFGDDRSDLVVLAQGIRTYTEQDHSEKMLTDMKYALKRSAAVVFLGFGFHKQNIDMLQIAADYQSPRVFVTGYGIDPHNYDSIKMRLQKIFRSLDTQHFEIADLTSEQLLSKRRQSIESAFG